MSQYAFPLEDTDYLAEQAQLWFSARTSGVYSSNNDLPATSVGGMRIAVGAGMAWLDWERFKGIVYANTDTVNLDLALADGALDRIDRVVVRYDIVANTVTLAIKQGALSANPVAPALQRDASAYEIALADIRVNRGTVEITQADIYDQRLNEAVCGVMRDGVTGIPTAQLQAQWEAWLAKIADIPLDETLADWLVARMLVVEESKMDKPTGTTNQILDGTGAPKAPSSIKGVGVPQGGIIMWSGSIANIPDGFGLCNGSNNTPDLRDRFIVGVGNTYQPGNTGGSASVILSTAQLPAHNHGGSGLTATSSGAHTHSADGNTNATGTASRFSSAGTAGTASTLSVLSGGTHNHAISGNTANSGSGQAHENRPPYYALCFIMKLYEEVS